MQPFLPAQTIELYQGEAYALFLAIGAVWRTASQLPTAEPPQPISLDLLLALPVLQRLAKRLWRVYEAEQRQVGKPRQKPRAFRLSCEEVGVLMRYVWPTASSFDASVLGKVQQKSLNLARYISF